MSMLQALLDMMSPDERVAEFGTVEEKRRYIAEKRAEDPNWVNTVFPPGKTKRGVGWEAPHKGVPHSVLQMMGGGRQRVFAARNGAKPWNSRKARAH